MNNIIGGAMTFTTILARMKRLAQEAEKAAGRAGIHPVYHQHGPIEWVSCIEFTQVKDGWRFLFWYNDDDGSTHIIKASMEQLMEVA